MAFDPEHIAKKVLLVEHGWTWNRKAKQWERGAHKVKRMADAFAISIREGMSVSGGAHDVVIVR